jgi:hypothetical protein
MGLYTITVTASIPQPSQASGLKMVSTSFDLNVTNDRTFDDKDANLNLAPTQNKLPRF